MAANRAKQDLQSVLGVVRPSPVADSRFGHECPAVLAAISRGKQLAWANLLVSW
jgi:hypothetical protein